MAKKHKPYTRKEAKNSTTYAKEAQQAYVTSSKASKESAGLKLVKPAPQANFIILTGTNNIPENQMTYFEKMHVVKDGISKDSLEILKKKAGLDYDKLAKALSVTRATLINKKNQEKFNASLSERILSLADIYSYGYEVFEEEERFNRWMFNHNQALGGITPFQLIDNQFGREEIKNLIGRIDHGVYS